MKRLKYIGVTGTQYIDTAFMADNNTRIVIGFKATNSNCHIFGGRTAFQNKAFLLYWASNSNYCVQVNNSCFNGGTFDLTAKHVVDMTASSMVMDGTVMATYSVDAFETIYNLYIASSPNSEVSENMQGEIEFCQIYSGNTLVRDYIPVLDDEGVACLYDRVSQAYCYNAGEGEFVAGPLVGTPIMLPRKIVVPTVTCTITVTGDGDQTYCYLTMPDGTKVTAAGTYAVTAGDVIECYTAAPATGYAAVIVLNGTTVAGGTGEPTDYSYIVADNATITLEIREKATFGITITEE